MTNHSAHLSSSAGTFSARYGSPTDARRPANDVVSRLLGHRSVRHFNRNPLPTDTLDQMLGAAQSASSSSNLQLWSAVVVEDEHRRNRMFELGGHQKHIVEAPLFLVWLADLSRATRVGKGLGVALDGVAYMESFVTAVVDTSLAAQNAVIAAESMGLGAVYIGGMRNHLQELAVELKLPPLVMPLFGMCIGWPDEDRMATVKPRLAQSVVLHREHYEPSTEIDNVAAYDTAMTMFQIEQGMSKQGWSLVQTDRLRDAAALGGRDKLLAAIHQLGFELR